MQTYNLYNILKEELQNGSKDIVTRQSGQVVSRETLKKKKMEQSLPLISQI